MTLERVADTELRPRLRLAALSARSFKEILRTVHLWAGLILCIPMILIGLSGSALLAQREILWLTMPAASPGEPQSIVRIVEAAQATITPGIKATWIDLPQARGKPASVQFIVSRRPVRTTQVYVDPVSLAILGSSEVVRRGPIMTQLSNMHEFLMLPSGIGLRIVGWVAVAMTFMALSGLYLWWPRPGRWKSAFLVKRGARGLRLHLDLHHAIGIWGLLIFLILSVSGIYLAFPQTVSSTLRLGTPPGPSGSTQIPGNAAHRIPTSPDDAVTLARALLPEARPTGVKLQTTQGAPFMVQMEADGVEPSIPPITVAFDSDNPEIVTIDDPRTYSLADRILNVGYALHFSVGMGGVWTFLVFLSGLLPLILAITGTTIWWMKRQNRLRMRA